MATYDCRHCRGSLSRTATTCPRCGKPVSWDWRPRARGIRELDYRRMPDAEFRAYARSFLIPMLVLTVVAWLAVAGMFAWLWSTCARHRYSPELRTSVMAVLEEEGATPRVRDLSLSGHDELVALRAVIEDGAKGGVFLSTAAALLLLLCVHIVWHLTADQREDQPAEIPPPEARARDPVP